MWVSPRGVHARQPLAGSGDMYRACNTLGVPSDPACPVDCFATPALQRLLVPYLNRYLPRHTGAAMRGPGGAPSCAKALLVRMHASVSFCEFLRSAACKASCLCAGKRDPWATNKVKVSVLRVGLFNLPVGIAARPRIDNSEHPYEYSYVHTWHWRWRVLYM